MPHPLNFLFGYVRISLPKDRAAEAVQIMALAGRVYRNFVFSGDEALFDTPFFAYKKLLRLFDAHEIPSSVKSRHGLPHVAWKYRKRYGIFLGAALASVMVILSGMIVWNVRVVGNSSLDEKQVKEALKQSGLDVGMWIWEIDTPVLENRILIENDEIAWISINIKGSVAEVEIRESVPEPPDEDMVCADVVAVTDGIVEWIENARGNILVTAGDTVSAGDILISGYYPADENVGERYTVAKGKVYARTTRCFEVSVPLTYERKRYTGAQKSKNYLVFFKKEVKIFGNSRNLWKNCDTINTVEYFETLSYDTLPFGIRTQRYLEYVTETVTRSEESAIELALYMLRCKMADGVSDGTLVKKEITGEFVDGEYRLVCKAEYIENIAVAVEREIPNG